MGKFGGKFLQVDFDTTCNEMRFVRSKWSGRKFGIPGGRKIGRPEVFHKEDQGYYLASNGVIMGHRGSDGRSRIYTKTDYKTWFEDILQAPRDVEIAVFFCDEDPPRFVCSREHAKLIKAAVEEYNNLAGGGVCTSPEPTLGEKCQVKVPPKPEGGSVTGDHQTEQDGTGRKSYNEDWKPAYEQDCEIAKQECVRLTQTYYARYPTCSKCKKIKKLKIVFSEDGARYVPHFSCEDHG